jgi:hypothetical protein
MVTINYKALSALQPVELRYQYYNNETLQSHIYGYEEGYNFYSVDALVGFKDVTCNRDSCLILTSATSLSSFFPKQNNINIGSIPGTFKLQARNSSVYYAEYNTDKEIIEFNSLSGTNFYISPVEGTADIVEIRSRDLYLQFDKQYPYTLRLNRKIIVDSEIYRQRFHVFYNNGTIMFKVNVNPGFRYLSFGSDNILRAVGLILNNTIINDYIFNCIPVTKNLIPYNFNPSINWATYYLDFPNQVDNLNVNVNKLFSNTPMNFLIDFPIEQAIKTGIVNINIANLKTGFTPAGGPTPVNNTYQIQ